MRPSGLAETEYSPWTNAWCSCGWQKVYYGTRRCGGAVLHVVGFSPMFHWSDSKIRVHLFTCVLALTVAHLMRRQADQAGLHLSVREMLLSLAGIQETVLLYPSTGGRPKARRVLTDHDATATQLADIFGLHAYAPRS